MATIKTILFLGTSVCLSTLVFPQKLSQSKFGVTAGLAYNTQVKNSDNFAPVSFSYHNRFSPYFGLIFRDSINKWLTIKTSVHYVQRGVQFNYKFENPAYNFYSNQLFTCHYISFPLQLNYTVKNFFIGVGVEGSILLKARCIMQFEENGPATGYRHKYGIDKWYGENQFQPVDAGYNFNTGYRFKRFEIAFSIFHGLVVPPKFFVFTFQHFEFQYLYQQTFMLGINYFPTFKRHCFRKD